MAVLSRNFYNRDTLIVARDLLCCKLCRRIGDRVLQGIIIETEAYKQNDPACHAYRGKTPRAITLFKMPGLSYVYFIYGMYYCFNVITEAEGVAGAVLIRALEPINLDNTNGPGKLCRELQITKDLNEKDLTDENSLIWLEGYKSYNNSEIVQTTRIGIKKAIHYPWRFYVKNNKFVSKF